MEQFDLIVIGAGPAGYVASIRASQLGLKTACIDLPRLKGVSQTDNGQSFLGGTCLNIGCIPSKALLESSEHFYSAKNKLAYHGIETQGLSLNLANMLKHKESIVEKLVNGIQFLFKKNKITTFTGSGKIISINSDGLKTIEITKGSEKTSILATRVLIATGSEPTALPTVPFNSTDIVCSTEALSFTSVPNHLIVIGGGAIGLELGSVWSRLGAKVTVIEYMDRICSAMDASLGNELQKSLQKQGINFLLGTEVLSVNKETELTLNLKNLKTNTESTLSGDKILVAVGRKPYTQNLGLENIGIELTKQGRIPVDAHYQTKIASIYAIGDVITGPMLAHKASEEGVAAVEIMMGQKSHVYYDAIPNIIYTWPEVASVGKTQEQLIAESISYKTGTFPFSANPRARTMDEQEGFVKILADTKTDRVLGVHIIGPRASDLIAEAVTIMEFGGSAEDIARTCHAHPTLSEAMKEAALAVDKKQIHL